MKCSLVSWMIIGFCSVLAACSFEQPNIDATATQLAREIFGTQTAEAPTATQTPTATLTLTPSPSSTPTQTLTPTNTPTVTPTPTPNYADLNLVVDDLPIGCEDQPGGLGAFFGQGDPFLDFTVQSAYEYQCFDFDDFLSIAGALIVLPDTRERLEFDNAAPFGLEAMLGGLKAVSASSIGPEPIELSDTEELGEMAVGASLVYEVADIPLPFRADMLIVRKGEIGYMIILIYPDGTGPLIAVEEVASRQTEKIDDFYQASQNVRIAESKKREVTCDDPLGCVVYGPQEPIQLGSALIISGPNADLGLDSQIGIEVAIDLRGEVAGHPVILRTEDDGCSADGGREAGQKLTGDPTILGIIGTSCSGAAVPMSQMVSVADYFMVSPSNTSPILTDPDNAWREGYFRTAPNDAVQGEAMADFSFNELGMTTAAAVHDGDPYTRALAAAFSASFEELGGQIVMTATVDLGDTNVIPLLAEVTEAGPPEMIFAPLFTAECTALATRANQFPGLENTVIGAADGCISVSAIEALGEAAEGMYFSGPDITFSGPGYDEFLDRYIGLSGTEPLSVFHAHAFDAANMVFDCVEQVGVTADDGSLKIGRQAMRDCLAATSGFQGLTGVLTCGPYGDCGDPRITVSVIEDGWYEPIWP